jgi:hypothetical protein
MKDIVNKYIDEVDKFIADLVNEVKDGSHYKKFKTLAEDGSALCDALDDVALSIEVALKVADLSFAHDAYQYEELKYTSGFDSVSEFDLNN